MAENKKPVSVSKVKDNDNWLELPSALEDVRDRRFPNQDVRDSGFPDLPSALKRVRQETKNSQEFGDKDKRCYPRERGTKEVDNPSLKDPLPDFDPDEFLDFIRNQGSREDRERAASAIIQVAPELRNQFDSSGRKGLSDSERPNGNTQPDAPALWSDRTTGREVSPAEFIRANYGILKEDGSWDPDGVTRADIRKSDLPLYNAYSQQVKRNPDQAIENLPSQPSLIDDPMEAIERRRAASREWKRRNRHPSILS